MKKGTFVLIDYKGIIKASGEPFADTSQKKPTFVVVGERMILPGVDDALLKMNVGEEQILTLAPKDGYGERNPALVKVIAMTHFRKNKIDPSPGDVMEIEGQRARVLSVSGGRVRIDFNHPLAGRELVCTVKIVKEVTDLNEKVSGVVDALGLPFKATAANDTATVAGPDVPDHMKQHLEKLIKKQVPEIKTVTFKVEKKPAAPKPAKT
ncbi:MAG: peptidylprolyl isomerase [Nanoarchaeota archaeon]|nr:peptidylprolyl isomerase [Nanoarchaeota archaeon]